jgi:hypothetical protein
MSAGAEANRQVSALDLKTVRDLASDVIADVEAAYAAYDAEKDSTENADRIEESKRFFADLEAQLADERRKLEALVAQGTAADRVSAKLGAAEIAIQGVREAFIRSAVESDSQRVYRTPASTLPI